jgi:NAD(P)H-flavin reductase
MAGWNVGDVVGVRGPYGNGWPVEEARGRDVVIITGGLGCARWSGLSTTYSAAATNMASCISCTA